MLSDLVVILHDYAEMFCDSTCYEIPWSLSIVYKCTTCFSPSSPKHKSNLSCSPLVWFSSSLLLKWTLAFSTYRIICWLFTHTLITRDVMLSHGPVKDRPSWQPPAVAHRLELCAPLLVLRISRWSVYLPISAVSVYLCGIFLICAVSVGLCGISRYPSALRAFSIYTITWQAMAQTSRVQSEESIRAKQA